MSREVIGGMGIIIVCLVLVAVMNWAGSYDKYVMRDGCVYHKTKEMAGESFDIEYTLVTCEENEFYKYEIEED
jgi:hypothetical protein